MTIKTSDPNLSASDLNGIKRDLAEYTEEVIRFILRTHCIVGKEFVKRQRLVIEYDKKLMLEKPIGGRR